MSGTRRVVPLVPVVPAPPDPGRRRAVQLLAMPAVFGPASAWAAVQARAQLAVASPGYGKDPALKDATVPWPRRLGSDERALLAEAADSWLPTDDAGPGAVALGIVDFLDEWLSAPYPEQQRDLALLREALPDVRAGTDLADPQALGREAELTRRLSERLRTLVVIGWGTTPEGAAQLGFVGNVPRASFDGVPPEVLTRLQAMASALRR